MIVLGNAMLLESDLAVVLNSSQSKTPCGNDAWILATTRAIGELVGQGRTIVTSIGLPTWELAAHLTAATGGEQVIINPAFDACDRESVFRKLLHDFELDETQVAVVFAESGRRGRSPKANWAARDRMALTMAKLVAPVSIRPKGRLAALIADDEFRNKVTDEFRVEYAKPLVLPPKYDIKKENPQFASWNGLTHWTRSCHGLWPGESGASYYRRLLCSGDEFPGNAFGTLMNIAREGIIRASSEKIRGGLAVVGFTEAAPGETLGLMRWCPRRVNWNFEPYGIVLDKVFSTELRIRPVIYGTDKEYEALGEADRPFFQSLGASPVDWSREKEWRKIGDLDLNSIPAGLVKFLVWREAEAERLRMETPHQVLALGE